MYCRHCHVQPGTFGPDSLVPLHNSRQHHLIFICLGRVTGSIMTCMNLTLFHLNFSSISHVLWINLHTVAQLQAMLILFHYPPSKNHFCTYAGSMSTCNRVLYIEYIHPSFYNLFSWKHSCLYAAQVYPGLLKILCINTLWLSFLQYVISTELSLRIDSHCKLTEMKCCRLVHI